jgi:hypothetical protein
MDSIIQLTALVITALITLFLGLALDWLLLRGMFRLMQPATANRRTPSAPIERGTRLPARAYGNTARN